MVTQMVVRYSTMRHQPPFSRPADSLLPPRIRLHHEPDRFGYICYACVRFSRLFTPQALVLSSSHALRRAMPLLCNLCVRALSLQAQEKKYAAQMARRKETIATLRARDEAPLARPKGYDPNHAERGKVGWGPSVRVLEEQRHYVTRSFGLVVESNFFRHCMSTSPFNSCHATESTRSQR